MEMLNRNVGSGDYEVHEIIGLPSVPPYAVKYVVLHHGAIVQTYSTLIEAVEAAQQMDEQEVV